MVDRSLTFYEGEDLSPEWDVTDLVKWEEAEFGTRAWRGESTNTDIPFRDEQSRTSHADNLPAGLQKIVFQARNTLEFVHGSNVLWRGRIANQSYFRGAQKAGRAREGSAYLEDINIDLRGIVVHGWARPAENDVDRLQGLIASYLSGSPRRSTIINGSNLINTGSNTVLLPAKTYNQTDPRAVIEDVATQANKTYYLLPRRRTTDAHTAELYYDGNDAVMERCPFRISDHEDEVDHNIVFPPIWNVGAAGELTAQETLSGVWLFYGQESYVHVADSGVADITAHWEEVIYDDTVTTEAEATAKANAIIQFRRSSVRRINVTIGPLGDEHIDSIRAGQRITIQAMAVPWADDQRYDANIGQLKITTPLPGIYFAHLELERPLKMGPYGQGDKASTNAPNVAHATPDTSCLTYEYNPALVEQGLDIIADGQAAGYVADFGARTMSGVQGGFSASTKVFPNDCRLTGFSLVPTGADDSEWPSPTPPFWYFTIDVRAIDSTAAEHRLGQWIRRTGGGWDFSHYDEAVPSATTTVTGPAAGTLDIVGTSVTMVAHGNTSHVTLDGSFDHLWVIPAIVWWDDGTTIPDISVYGEFTAVQNQINGGPASSPGESDDAAAADHEHDYVATGGSAGQHLAKRSSADYNTEWVDSPPVNANYLVGTANASLSNEIVVGTTPGGELGGTWASPTVDATHAGSDHNQPVRKNSTGTVFERRRLNLIEGSNVTLTVADDAGNDEVDITIAASGGGGSLTVEEVDGAPSVIASTIVFPNGTLTDNGGGEVEYTPTGGGSGNGFDYSSQSVIRDECFFGGTAAIYEGSIAQAVNGTGAATSDGGGNVGFPGPHHPGIITLSTGTTTTGRAALIANQNTSFGKLAFGSGRVRFGNVIRTLNSLSDATNRYLVLAGFNTSASAESNDAVLFRYRDNINSGNWQAVVRDGGSETVADTGLAVASSTWYRLEIDVAADLSSIDFFIDGVNVATISAGIPAFGVYNMLPLAIIKSAGSSVRTWEIDAYWYIFDFDPSR